MYQVSAGSILKGHGHTVYSLGLCSIGLVSGECGAGTHSSIGMMILPFRSPSALSQIILLSSGGSFEKYSISGEHTTKNHVVLDIE